MSEVQSLGIGQLLRVEKSFKSDTLIRGTETAHREPLLEELGPRSRIG